VKNNFEFTQTYSIFEEEFRGITIAAGVTETLKF
jgi:hypothetical protein